MIKIKVNFGLMGMTLVELAIAIAILGLGVIVVLKSTSGLANALLSSRKKAQADSLIDSHIGSLEKRPYNEIPVSNNPTAIPDLNPIVFYDGTNYPIVSQNLLGRIFKLYTLVERVKVDPVTNNVAIVPANDPDTGLKRIRVTAVWSDRGSLLTREVSRMKAQDLPGTTVRMTGQVTETNGDAVPFALVRYASLSGLWDTVTDGNGNFSFSALSGSGNLIVRRPPLFAEASRPVAVAPNEFTKTENMVLSRHPLWDVSGVVWTSTRPLISMIAGNILDGAISQEFVELYNPSTFPWTVQNMLKLRFGQDNQMVNDVAIAQWIQMEIQPNGFYLFANQNTVTILGVTRNADARWNGPIIQTEHENGGGVPEGYGGLELVNIPDGTVLDRVGWQKNNAQRPQLYSVSPINNILHDGEAFFRRSSTSTLFLPLGGSGPTDRAPAYNSGDNSLDFFIDANPKTPYGAHGPLFYNRKPVAGTPAVGALVIVSEISLSQPATAVAALDGSFPVARWSVANVPSPQIPASGVGFCPGVLGDLTGRSLTAFELSQIICNDPGDFARFSGIVTNESGTPLQDISVGDFYTLADGSFDSIFHLLDMFGNPYPYANEEDPVSHTPLDPRYWSGYLPNPVARMSSIFNISITLPARCRIEGRVVMTDTVSGFDQFPVKFSQGGTTQDVSPQADGSYFYYSRAGAWTIQPVVPSDYVSNPASRNIIVTNPGDTAVAGDFVISKTINTEVIRGVVTLAGKPVRENTIILANTGGGRGMAGIGGIPRPGLFYSTVVQSDGTYRLVVPATAGGTNYSVEAWLEIIGPPFTRLWISAPGNPRTVNLGVEEIVDFNFP
jgi:hypothetical protein